MRNLHDKTAQVIRKSENFFQADMVYIAKGGFWVGFGQILSSVISLGLVIAFANLLPKETYGTYRYILSLAGILNIFSLTGMNSAVSRAVAGGDEGALKTSVKYQLKWHVLIMIAFFILSTYYYLNGDSIFGNSFLVMGIFIPLTISFNTYGSYLEGKKDFRLSNIANVFSTLFYALGILIVIFLSQEVVWLIVAYSLTTFLSTFIFYKYTLHKYHPPNYSDSDVIQYGKELTFIGFIGPISSQIDKIILIQFWGPAQLAIYTLALAIPERIASLMKSWITLGLPKFVKKTPSEINSVFYKRIIQGMSLGAIIAIFYALLSPFVFTHLLPRYSESIIYSQILAASFIFAMPNRYVSLLLESQKLSRLIFQRSVTQSIIAICLYIILGIWGGVMGLVFAYLLNTSLGMVNNIFIWRRYSKLI